MTPEQTDSGVLEAYPPMNAITAEIGTEQRKYPNNSDELRYLILYPEDYEGHGVDVAGNVALLLTKDNAKEVKKLAEQIIEDIEE